MDRGYVGGVQFPVLQEWSPSGSQDVDRGAHPPGASGVGAQATGYMPTPGFGSVCLGSLATDQSAHPPGVSGVGTQAADRCAHLPGGLGL